MLRRFIVVFIFFAFLSISLAQDTSLNYQTVLDKIEDAYHTQATSLNLANYKLTELPPEIGKLTHLTELNLAYNSLEELPPEIRNLKQLRVLILKENALRVVPAVILELQSLEKLDLSKTYLSRLPVAFDTLANLKILDLSFNGIEGFPSVLANFKKLEWLGLGSNHLQALPPAIGNLTTLKELSLHNAGLHRLPPEIGNLTQLETLTLSFNNLQDVPSEFSNLQNLKVLDIRNNIFYVIPDGVIQLENLHTLNLSDNRITESPSNLQRLKKLQSLDLSHNAFTTIPDGLFDLTGLRHLNLTGNDIHTVSSDIEKLTSLTELFLSHNQLTTLPSGISNLSNLSTLDISLNPLSTVPTAIYQLKSLQVLNMNTTQLASLASGIGDLTQLRELDLGGNLLSNLPADMNRLDQLETLNLWNNKLTAFPMAAAHISNLQTLHLSLNQITTLPAEIGNLKSLQKLNVVNNPLQALPPEIGKLESLCYLEVGYTQIRSFPPELANLNIPNSTCSSFVINLYGNPPMELPNEVLIGGGEAILTYLKSPASWYLERLLQWIVVFSSIFIVIRLISHFIDRNLLKFTYANEMKIYLKRAAPNRRLSYIFALPLFLVAMSPIVDTVYRQDELQIGSVLVISLGMFWLITLGTIRATLHTYYHISTLDTLHAEHPRRQFLVSLWSVVKHRWGWHLMCVVMFISLGLAMNSYMHYGYTNGERLLGFTRLFELYGFHCYIYLPKSSLPMISHIIPTAISFIALTISHIGMVFLLSVVTMRWGLKRMIFALLAVIVVGWVGAFTLEHYRMNFYVSQSSYPGRTSMRIYESIQTILMNTITTGTSSLASVLDGSLSSYYIFPIRHLLIVLATAMGQIGIGCLLLWKMSFNRKRKRQG